MCTLSTCSMPGGELFDRLIKWGVYSEEEAKPLFKQVAEALHYLHRCVCVPWRLRARAVMPSVQPAMMPQQQWLPWSHLSRDCCCAHHTLTIRRGIIHRDLKPENLLLTDGTKAASVTVKQTRA